MFDLLLNMVSYHGESLYTVLTVIVGNTAAICWEVFANVVYFLRQFGQ